MAWRGQSLPLPVSHWRKGSVGPRLESATVERRKGSRSRREGPRLTSAGVAPRTRDRSQRVRLSALHPPLGRGDGIAAVATAAGAKALVGLPADGKAKVHAKRRINPDAATRRGNEEHCVRLSEGAQHENRLI